MHLTSTRVRGFVLCIIALAAALPSEAYAQIASHPTPACRPLVIPSDLASEVGEFELPQQLCAGDTIRIEIKDSKKVVRGPGLLEKETESETEVHKPSGTVAAAEPRPLPQDLEVEDLARLGYATHVEESLEVRQSGDSRTEKRNEETTVTGEGFTYESEESSEEIDEPGFHSEEEESEEEFVFDG